MTGHNLGYVFSLILSSKTVRKTALLEALDNFSAPALREIAEGATRIAYLANVSAADKERLEKDFADLKEATS